MKSSCRLNQQSSASYAFGNGSIDDPCDRKGLWPWAACTDPSGPLFAIEHAAPLSYFRAAAGTRAVGVDIARSRASSCFSHSALGMAV